MNDCWTTDALNLVFEVFSTLTERRLLDLKDAEFTRWDLSVRRRLRKFLFQKTKKVKSWVQFYFFSPSFVLHLCSTLYSVSPNLIFFLSSTEKRNKNWLCEALKMDVPCVFVMMKISSWFCSRFLVLRRSVTSLLLLKDLIKSVSPPAAGRLALFTLVLLHRAPPGRELDARHATTAWWAGRGGGREDELAVGGVRRDAEGACGAGGGEGGGRAAPQLPEAGALLEASSQGANPRTLTLPGVEPGWKEEGLGAVQVSWLAMRVREGGVRVWAVHNVPEKERGDNDANVANMRTFIIIINSLR